MSSNTLPVCPKTGSTSPSLTVHLCLHTALLREIGNAPLKTSPAYNEMLPRARMQNGLNARVNLPDRSHIAWSIADPVDSDSWMSSQIMMITGLLVSRLASAMQNSSSFRPRENAIDPGKV